MSDAPLLAIHNLCTFYGTSQVLFDVSLEAPQKGAIAILGRNGAGKTTLLKSIVGELRPRAGEVHLDGIDSTRLPTEVRIRRGIGYVPQEQAVFGGLSVQENLRIGALGSSEVVSIDEVLRIFPKLKDRLDQLAGTLIPTVIDQNPCAHLRMPRDMIFHGWSMRLFQAWQHSATMSS